MSGPAPGATAAELSARFTELTALVERVAQQSNAQVDTEVHALEERTLQARKLLLWRAALLLPLAMIAVLVLTLLASDGRCASSTAPSASSARAPSPTRSRSPVPTTSSVSAGSSSGCGSACSSSRTSATASCGTCRTS